VPRGAVLLENPNGTAPGLWLERGRTAIVLLPGPPREMKPMFEAVVRDRLAPRSGASVLLRRVLKITGRTESDVDSCVQPIYSRWVSEVVPVSTTILAVMGQIELYLTACAGTRADADRALDRAVRELENTLGDAVYSVDGSALEKVVGDLLRERRFTIAVAESCSGGLLSSRLTDVPGSSDYLDTGVVSYSNKSKVEWVGVPESIIAEHGAVSEPVARAMAAGVRARAAVDVGIGITGIAGPGGGTAEKPVGTVAIAVIVHDLETVRTFQFIGGREMVKFQASQAALNILRLMLLKAGSRS
jgi:nicotinamide-nucleotide amidase